MSYRTRRLARAERLRDWADTRQHKAAAAFKTAKGIADGIPFGQPILVGHHSERHARRDQDRIYSNMSAGVAHEAKAESMTAKAAELERQADASIYSDDEDVIDRLKDRIADLEAQRDRIKAINKMLRTCGMLALAKGDHRWEQDGTLLLDPPLTDAERQELITIDRIQPYYDVPNKGYPPYQLANLNGNLARQRKRLAELSGNPARWSAQNPLPKSLKETPESLKETLEATATARAGLVIDAGMTTPHRAGKQPRPVWTVRGDFARWRPMLVRLGGNWYRGAFSFWDDPTEAIEAECHEVLDTTTE